MKPGFRPFVQALNAVSNGSAVPTGASKVMAAVAADIKPQLASGSPPPKGDSLPPRAALASAAVGAGSGDGQNGSPWRLGNLAKGAAVTIGVGILADKVAENFFLSTTSLHDGKGGFTSNERLIRAQEEAQVYRQRHHDAAPEDQVRDSRPPSVIRRVGNNEFVTMTDFRAATKLYVADSVNTREARESLLTSLACFTGERIKPELVAKYKPLHVPTDFDLTKSAAFREKNKYALAGVPNEKTGASGYTSRSATQPFVNKGVKHYKDESQARGLSPQECMHAFEAALRGDSKLCPEAQFAAGQFILNFRQVFALDEHWGHAERVVLPALRNIGLASQEETDKIDATLMFEDPSKSVFTRNTSLIGPMLQKIDTAVQSFRLRNDPDAVEDVRSMGKEKNIEGLPIAHFKVNEQGNGFEDCSGLGDSFTCVNAVACLNYARVLSGEERLSKDEVKVIVACLNAVYDDASSVRHTLHEIARGCFAGAGYTSQDADEYYAAVCKQASQEFYVGKSLAQPITA